MADSVLLYRLDGTEVPVEVNEGERVKDLLLRNAEVLGAGAHLLELTMEGRILDPESSAADLRGALVNVLVKAELSVESLAEAFRFLDADGSGAIDVRELRAGWEDLLGAVPSKDVLQLFIHSYDANGDGVLDTDEFASFMRAEALSAEHEALRLALVFGRHARQPSGAAPKPVGDSILGGPPPSLGTTTVARLDGTEFPLGVEEGDTVRQVRDRAAEVIGTPAHLLVLVREGQVLDLQAVAADLSGAKVTAVVKAELPVEVLKELFDFVDIDRSEEIDAKELKEGWKKLLGVTPSKEQLIGLICAYDLDGSGTLYFDEFAHFMRADDGIPDHKNLRRALESRCEGGLKA